MGTANDDALAICDLETGICMPAGGADEPAAEGVVKVAQEIIYVGDPMCSWCWGISPALESLQAFADEKGMTFTVVTGGLRPGCGDAWTPSFKDFLRHHWEEIGARTGQPFSFKLLDKAHYNYDTEPACRAVVVARDLLPAGGQERLLAFFAAVQKGFFAEGRDPSDVGFYEDICGSFGLDFAAFSKRFASPEAKAATREDFALSRGLGVRAFPTVLFRKDGTVRTIASGYASADTMIRAIERASLQAA